MQANQTEAGITLLEVLVALAVFALLAVLVYGGLNNLLYNQSTLSNRQAALVNLQSGLHQIKRDFNNLLPKAIINQEGQLEPAFRLHNDQFQTLSITTRVPYTNYGQVSSYVHRVSYSVRDGILWRTHQPILRNQLLSPQHKRPLISGISALNWRLDKHNSSSKTTGPEARSSVWSSPKSVELSIHTQLFGWIKLHFHGLDPIYED